MTTAAVILTITGLRLRTPVQQQIAPRIQVIKKAAKKPNKFNAKKTVYAGETFDSIAESSFYRQLLLQKKAVNDSDRVVEIERQPIFEVSINGIMCFKYLSDFRVTYADGRVRIFDVKGHMAGASYTIFRLKQKCVEALYDIRIEIVQNCKILTLKVKKKK